MKLCREKIRKAKAQLELNKTTEAKDNNNSFYKYVNNKSRAQENLHPGGNIVIDSEEKTLCYLMPSLPS